MLDLISFQNKNVLSLVQSQVDIAYKRVTLAKDREKGSWKLVLLSDRKIRRARMDATLPDNTRINQ